MKFLLALVVLALLFVGVGFFMSGNYEVSRSVVIQAPKDQVHAQVNNLRTWPSWSALQPPTAENAMSQMEGEGVGVGTAWRWGGLGQIKPARIEILASDPNVGIRFELSLDGGSLKTLGAIVYEDVDGGVRVTMSNAGKMEGFLRKRFSFMVGKRIAPMLQGSMDGLKLVVEGSGKMPPGQDEEAGTVGNEKDENSVSPDEASRGQ